MRSAGQSDDGRKISDWQVRTQKNQNYLLYDLPSDGKRHPVPKNDADSGMPVKAMTAGQILEKQYQIDGDRAARLYLYKHWAQMRQVTPGWTAVSCNIRNAELVRVHSVLCQDPEHVRIDFIFQDDIEYYTLNRELEYSDAMFVDIEPFQNREGYEFLKEYRTFHRRMQFAVRTMFRLVPGHSELIWASVKPYNRKEEAWLRDRRLITLDKYLIPVMPKEAYDDLASMLWRTYMPECIGAPWKMDADLLARRMGLRVFERNIPDDDSTLGVYFSDDCIVETINETGQRVRTQFHAGDILLNKDLCEEKNVRDSTLIHECGHAALDQYFFAMQGMAGTRDYCCASRDLENTHSKGKQKDSNDPLDWIEIQAKKFPAYLMMPKDVTTQVIEERLAYYGGRRNPQTIKKVIEDLKDIFGVSRSMAKYRMEELGYREAEGVDNFVDGAYRPDYQVSGERQDGVSYTISVRDAAALFASREDPEFLRQAESGRYLFIENRFCLNTPRYIRTDAAGRWELTSYAREHINECCLGFRPTGKHEPAPYVPGMAARKKKIPFVDILFSRYKLASSPDGLDTVEVNRMNGKDFRRSLQFGGNRSV